MIPVPQLTSKCSFCSTPEGLVGFMVKGAGGGYICDKCITEAGDIIVEAIKLKPKDHEEP